METDPAGFSSERVADLTDISLSRSRFGSSGTPEFCLFSPAENRNMEQADGLRQGKVDWKALILEFTEELSGMLLKSFEIIKYIT